MRLIDSDGSELQRLSYTANVAQTAFGGGCDITIGPGGQFERLDSELLTRLLQEGRGDVCICFLPGEHRIESIEGSGEGKMRLSLHGCGPTAVLRVERNIEFGKFAAIELRDLLVELRSENGVALKSNNEVRLSGVSLARRARQQAEPCLLVAGAGRVHMTGCTIGASSPASAVFEAIAPMPHQWEPLRRPRKLLWPTRRGPVATTDRCVVQRKRTAPCCGRRAAAFHPQQRSAAHHWRGDG